ncbi:MAG: hypothetical protein ACRDK9_15290 [Solirubrobacterales bacterium]
MVRRAIALGVGVVIVILLVLAVRGCLDARKERGFENYVSDLGSIVTASNQLSNALFQRLQDPPRNLDELALEADIAADRGTAEGLLQRVEGLDTPDELSGAQGTLIFAFELRRDALAGIATAIPTALGEEGRTEATDEIAGRMQTFLASDVLYDRARSEIQSVLDEEEIAGSVQRSRFLPPPPERWVDELEVTTLLSAFAAEAGTVAPGVHGLALLSTSVGDAPLTADAENTIQPDGTPELEIEVQNQGDTEERDILIVFELSGGTQPIEGELTIRRLDSQGIETATLGIDPEPETGVPLTLEVTALPVAGEQVVDNNTATYTVTFE